MFHLLVLISKLVPILFLANKLAFSGKSTAVPGQACREAVLQPAPSWELAGALACRSLHQQHTWVLQCNQPHVFPLHLILMLIQRVFRVETLVHGLIHSSYMGMGGYCRKNLTTITSATLGGLCCNSISPGLHNYRIRCYCSFAHQSNAAKNKPGRHSSPKAQEGSGM